MISQRMPELAEHLQEDENELLLTHLTMGPWIRLFVNEVPKDVEEYIWDLLFLKGSCVLFMVTLTILKIY